MLLIYIFQSLYQVFIEEDLIFDFLLHCSNSCIQLCFVISISIKCFVQIIGWIFQVGNAISTNASLRQWVDLGVNTEVCLRNPDSCSQGAAVSFWFNLNTSPYESGIVSAIVNGGRGFCIVYNQGTNTLTYVCFYLVPCGVPLRQGSVNYSHILFLSIKLLVQQACHCHMHIIPPSIMLFIIVQKKIVGHDFQEDW